MPCGAKCKIFLNNDALICRYCGVSFLFLLYMYLIVAMSKNLKFDKS